MNDTCNDSVLISNKKFWVICLSTNTLEVVLESYFVFKYKK